MQFRIGYPIDSQKEEDRYAIIVEAVNDPGYHSVKGGMTGELKQHSGAYFVWERASEFIRDKYRYLFEPIGKKNLENLSPQNLFDYGYSDSVASLLGLIQYTSNSMEKKNIKDSPVVLISCSFCYQDPNLGWKGLRLNRVTHERKVDAKYWPKSLYRKWQVVCVEQALALVLHEEDADFLSPYQDIIRIGLEQGIFRKLADLKKSNTSSFKPHLISCKSGDLPLLAEALGIDSRPLVKPKNHKATQYILLILGIATIIVSCYYLLKESIYKEQRPFISPPDSTKVDTKKDSFHQKEVARLKEEEQKLFGNSDGTNEEIKDREYDPILDNANLCQLKTSISFWKIFGEEHSKTEFYSVQEANDEGFIVAGFSMKFGIKKLWLVKVGKDGKLLWEKILGETEFTNSAISARITSDGGYIIASSTKSSGINQTVDGLLIKTDKNGNILWNRVFGGPKNDVFSSVLESKEGDFVSVGHTLSHAAVGKDLWLIKVDNNGKFLWEKTFGGASLYNSITSIQETKDGGYIIASSTHSIGEGSGDIWLIKTDKDGNDLWNRTFGGKYVDSASSVQNVTNGGFVVVGNTNSFGAGWSDIWLLRVDEEGNKLWHKVFGGKNADKGNSVCQTSDGSFIIAGYTLSYGRPGSNIEAGKEMWLIKIKANGNKLWDASWGKNLWLTKLDGTESKPFGDEDSNEAFSIQETKDKKFIIAGTVYKKDETDRKAWLMKIELLP
jgi:hypothetical protein